MAAIDPAILDVSLRDQADSVVVAMRSTSGQHCALEVVFGRHKFANQVSIFVGLGAEFCNAEPLATRDQALDLAQDLRQLISSEILGSEETIKGSVSRATYKVLSRERAPIQLTYYGSRVTDGIVEARNIVYAPWLA